MRPWMRWSWLLLFALFANTTAHSSSLIYKNYIVRYDRGWDVLCEPYVVQKGDWVIKILRQKGELAHQDFREFLGIFQRLNPHIPDVNLIRPGQTVDIPLRKLEHGALPGQASGLVTIPFVSLTKVTDAILQNAQPYRVQRGDTVSQLIAKRFGPVGSQSYKEGIKLLKAANAQISDIDRIYTGQKIYMPEPAIREKEWYDSLFDEEGNLRETINKKSSAAPAPSVMPSQDKSLPADSGSAEAKPKEPPQDVLTQAAATVGGTLIKRGTYFIPRTGQSDFEIDLSRYPLLNLQSQKVLFTQDNTIMGQAPETVESSWPNTKVVEYNESASVQDVVAGIFQSLDEGEPTGETEVGFNDQGVYVAVRAKWIKTDNQQRKLCILPIESVEEQTPESFRRYLEQNGIMIREVLPSGQAPGTDAVFQSKRHMVKNVLSLASTDQKYFVQDLCRALAFTYAPNVPVSFNYAGIQIQAFANLISTPGGNELLMDFGELYGDAVEALRKSGLTVLQVNAEDGYTSITRKLLTGLGVTFSESPAFFAASRPPRYNTSVTVNGFLYTDAHGQRTLLSGTALPPAITDLLSNDGIAVVTW